MFHISREINGIAHNLAQQVLRSDAILKFLVLLLIIHMLPIQWCLLFPISRFKDSGCMRCIVTSRAHGSVDFYRGSTFTIKLASVEDIKQDYCSFSGSMASLDLHAVPTLLRLQSEFSSDVSLLSVIHLVGASASLSVVFFFGSLSMVGPTLLCFLHAIVFSDVLFLQAE